MPDSNATYLQKPVKSYYYTRPLASGYSGFPGFENYNNIYYVTNTAGRTLSWFLTENYNNGVMSFRVFLKTIHGTPSSLTSIWHTTTENNVQDNDIDLESATISELNNINTVNLNTYTSSSQDTTYDSSGVWHSINVLNKVTYDQSYYSFHPEFERKWVLFLKNTLNDEPNSDYKTNDLARIDDYEFSNLNINEHKPYFYREVSGVTNAIKSDRIYITTNVLQGDGSNNNIQRMFLKFQMPNINGKLEYSFLVLHSHYVPQEELLLPFNMTCLLSNSDSDWNESSNTTTLNSIYNSSVSNDVNAGFLSQNSSNEYYFFNVAGTENFNNNGILDSIENNLPYVTLILDSPEVNNLTNTVTPGTSGDGTIIRIGTSGNIKYFVGKRLSGSPTQNTPVIIYGWTPPQMNVSTNSISWQTPSGTNSTTNSFNISNGGQGILNASSNINYISGSGWFTLNTDTSTLNLGPGDSQALSYTINSSGLAPGTYNATLTLYSSDSEPDTRNIDITLTVQDDAYIYFDQNDVEYGIYYKTPISNLTFTANVENITSEQSPYDYTIDKLNNVNWIESITPSSGFFAHNTSHSHNITITFNTDNLSPGVHEETIQLKHLGDVEDSFNITVRVYTTSSGVSYSYEII